MSLRLVRSVSNGSLWSACASRFLDEVGDHRGPEGFPSRMWVAHRCQRDALFGLAAERGLPGWLSPPVSFFSELPRLFGIERRPIGLLTGRLLVARLASREARRWEFETRAGGPARAHMLDPLFSELLPEGISAAELREALDGLEGDEFTRRRNGWVADTYEAFLAELEARDRYDPRAIHALVAQRVEVGRLREALRGAERLHVYGVTSLRGRRRLFRALAADPLVEVTVYLPEEETGSEWEELLAVREVEKLAPPPGWREAEGAEEVRPAPDALREAAWVARRVKRLLYRGEVEPHEVAVVARSGRRDTRILHRMLEECGVPATARLRTPLAEIPALKALLALFRAEARGWTYRSLREVLESPYLAIDIDLRIVDWISRDRRIEGLDAWQEQLVRVHRALAEGERRLRREGVYLDRAGEAVQAFSGFRRTIAPLAEKRPEAGWLDLTVEILGGGWLGFRRLLCRPAGGVRWDIVRLDQRGVVRLEQLLREWRALLEEGLRLADEALAAGEWHDRLRRLLEANELALSTPLRTGVQVVEAHEAALTPFRQLFLVHANDGEFPRASQTPRVFTEEERERLRAVGLPLTNRAEALRRERTLWRAVTGSDRVVITYRTTDATGAPRLPSLMVPEHDPAAELPRTLEMGIEREPEFERKTGSERDAGSEEKRTSALGERVPGRGVRETEPVSPVQHRRLEIIRLKAVRTSHGGENTPFVTPEPERIRHAVLAAFAEELRSGALDEVADSLFYPGALHPLGAAGSDAAAALFQVERPLSLRPHTWNGRLRDPVVLAALRTRFGDDYVWSSSQLQTYGVRPFDFLLDRVLWIREAEEAEEETSPLADGKVTHALLERFYAEVMEDLPKALEGETAALYERVAEEVCRRAEADAEQWLGRSAIWAVRRLEIVDRVRDFLREELRRLVGWGERPVCLEYAFGDRGADGGERSGRPCVVIEGEDPWRRTARLAYRGRIDRVDVKGDGARARRKVIDYKSRRSYPPGRGYRDGATLQTALYMRAYEELEGEPVHEGVFRTVKGQGWNMSSLKRGGVADVLRLALGIPPRVRAGLFEAVQAWSTPISDWQPKRSVTRSERQLESGSRFDPVVGETPPDA